MNLMEWEVGIPGKQHVSINQPLSILGDLLIEIFVWLIVDRLGRRFVQARNDFSRRYAFVLLYLVMLTAAHRLPIQAT